MPYQEMAEKKGKPPGHVTVIYNPVSGQGCVCIAECDCFPLNAVLFCPVPLYIYQLFFYSDRDPSYPSLTSRSKARKVVDQLVVPVLTAAGVRCTAVATQYRGFATEHVLGLGELVSTRTRTHVCRPQHNRRRGRVWR